MPAVSTRDGTCRSRGASRACRALGTGADILLVCAKLGRVRVGLPGVGAIDRSGSCNSQRIRPRVARMSMPETRQYALQISFRGAGEVLPQQNSSIDRLTARCFNGRFCAVDYFFFD